MWSWLSFVAMILFGAIGQIAFYHSHDILGGAMSLLIVASSGVLLWKGNIARRCPLIYIWAHNSVTAVADDESYLEAIDAVPTGTLHPRPEPTRLAYFTDDPEARKLLGKYYTGSNVELNEFAKWCRVERTEMSVRRIPRGTPVDLATLQFIVGEGIITTGMHH